MVGWGAWGECEQGERIRQEEIVEDSIGAGLACPELLQLEVEGNRTDSEPITQSFVLNNT